MAEDFNHIDQIIRQKFENFEPEPPMQVWENIKSGISKTPPPPSSPGIILPIVVTISLLIFISGLLYHLYNANSISNQLNAEAPGMTIQTAGVISTGSTTVSDPSLQETFYQTPQEVPVAAVAADDEKPAENTVIPVRVPFEQKAVTDRHKKSEKKDQPSASNPASRSGQWKPGLAQAIAAGELSYADAVAYDLSIRDIRKFSGYSDYARLKRANWSLGLYFNPEVTSCRDENIENTISYNVSVLPKISFSHLFIQSGINMRFTNDKGNYAVDYNRYLGSYEDLYLITFDSTENGVIPTYYTNTVDVYDTINHYSVSQTKVGYTYMEIPLFIGYRYSFGKFSLFAKAGPSASFLLSKNMPETVYPEDKAKIVNVDYQVPTRSVINWQMMMGAGFDYQFADKLSFSFEPTFRIAMKPEYDLPDASKGKTSAFGIRLGLNYNF
jgi:hypothetical protein